MKWTAAAILVMLINGCASLGSVDRSRLNHPAMDMASNRVAPPPTFLTNLGSIQGSSGGNGCSVCAH